MATLIHCIKKAGKALDADDAALIQAANASYVDQGLGPHKAAVAAINEVLSDLRTEAADLAQQVEAKGGDIAPVFEEVGVSEYLPAKETPEPVAKKAPVNKKYGLDEDHDQAWLTPYLDQEEGRNWGGAEAVYSDRDFAILYHKPILRDNPPRFTLAVRGATTVVAGSQAADGTGGTRTQIEFDPDKTVAKVDKRHRDAYLTMNSGARSRFKREWAKIKADPSSIQPVKVEPPKTLTETKKTLTETAKKAFGEDFGKKNKIFTDDGRAERLKRMKAKAKDYRTGIDPELMQDTIQEVGRLVEGGVRAFGDVMDAMIEEFGDWIKPYVRPAYSAVRDYPGLDTEGMSTAVEMETEELGASVDPADRFYSELRQSVKAGEITDNLGLKKFIAAREEGTVTPPRMKEAQEMVELAIVENARERIAEGGTDAEIYNDLVEMYKAQPLLNVRSSTSMENQAYSTPAPIAWLSSQMAGITQETTVLEPTAGNGMLLIGADLRNAFANELNDDRVANLEQLGLFPTQEDALNEIVSPGSVDAVIMNPPFGKMDEPTRLDGYKVTQIDHAIAGKQLEAMKDDGRAVLIIGANMDAGSISPRDKTFFNWLYGRYNVVDHFEIDGKMYTRQGASWPIRVITIDGRVESDRLSPRSGEIERLSAWDEIYEHYEQVLGSIDGGGRVNTTESPSVPVSPGVVARDPVADEGQVSTPAATGNQLGGTGVASPGVSGATAAGQPTESGGRDTRVGPVAEDILEEPGVERDTGGDRGSETAVGKREPGKPGKRDSGSVVAEGSEYQAEYKARSGGVNDNILIPNNMAAATAQALEELESEVGPLEQYVMDELGYNSLEEVIGSEDKQGAFMALQVDAVAAAVSKIKQNKAVIIADQTGVGKGRQAAGIIRYALEQGKTPIFLTKTPNLFTDMYEDLEDIGVTDIRPLIVNNGQAITKEDSKERLHETKMKSPEYREMLSDLAVNGLPENNNMLFMTYSQTQLDNAPQRAAIAGMADNAIFIMDEAHEVAGQRETLKKVGDEYVKKQTNAGVFFDVIEDKPVVYLSATWAKRADNVPIYYRTSMMDAVDTVDELVNAVTAGGVPLQTVVSNMLARAGEFFRREKSFKGISIPTVLDTENAAEHRKISDSVTTALNAIIAADMRFTAVQLPIIIKEAEEAGGSAFDAGNDASGSVDHTEFSSVVHNMISQMLLGLKTRKAAEDAIAAHERGEKPVLALEHTLGSFLERYTKDNGIEVGDVVEADYRVVLERALYRTMRVSIKDEFGNKPVVRQLEYDQLTPSVKAYYDKVRAIIEGTDVGYIPMSPIDYMKNKMEEAGMKVGEITGRKLTIDYGNGGILGVRKGNESSSRRGIVDSFNAGRTDALILNAAGSTGLSIHASSKFKNTSHQPRHMIVVQPMLNVNTLVQMLGRINRTGQIQLPIYTLMGLDLPTEKRPLAVSARKLASLNANTSSNDKSDLSVDAPDMMNKYGDAVADSYLQDDPELAGWLGLTPSDPDNPSVMPGLMAKMTGRMALLNIDVQTAIYEDIEGEYTRRIEYLDAIGQNDLSTSRLDLKAKILDSQIAYEGKAPGTIFGGHTTVHKARVNRLGKPPTPGDVQTAIEKATKDADPKDLARKMWADKQADESFRVKLDARLGEAREAKAKALAALEEDPDSKKLQAGAAGGARSVESAESAILHYETTQSAMKADIQRFVVGSRHNLDLGDEGSVAAVVVGVKDLHKPGRGSPYRKSSLSVTFMVNAGMRQVTPNARSLSNVEAGGVIEQTHTGEDSQWIEDNFTGIRSGVEAKETRYIATGNLIAASSKLGKGRITLFTDAQGREYQGVLLPKTFTDDRFSDISEDGGVAVRDVSIAANYLRNPQRELLNGPLVKITHLNDGDYAIRVPKSKKNALAKKIMFDRELRDLMGTDFYGSRQLVAKFSEEKLESVLERLLQLTPLYSSNRQWVIEAGGSPRAEAVGSFDAKGAEFDQAPEAGTDQLPPDGLSQEAVESAIAGELENVRAAGINVKVWSWEDTPAEVRAHKRSPRGWARNNGVNLIHDAITSAQQARITFAHELYGHIGPNKIVGDGWPALMEDFAKLKKLRGKRFLEIHRKVMERYAKRIIDKPHLEVKEFIAIAAEMRVTEGPVGRFMRKIREAVNAGLKRLGFARPFSMTDIDTIISQGEKYVQTATEEASLPLADVMEFDENDPGDGIPSLYDTLGTKQDTWKKRVSRLYRRNFTSIGLMPQNLFNANIKRNDMIAVFQLDISHTIGTFRKAVKTAMGVEYESLDALNKERIDDQFKSTELDETLPVPVLEVIVGMREQVRALSTQYATMLYDQVQDMMTKGDAKAQEKGRLLLTIIKNLDTYAHRSYRAFDDPTWPDKVPEDVFTEAVDLLEAQYGEMLETRQEQFPGWAFDGDPDWDTNGRDMRRFATAKARKILEDNTAFDGLESFIKESKLGAKDLSVLKRRKQIAPEIRALLGEYRDVEINYAKTIAKMSRLIYNQLFLERMVEIGEGDFLFEGKPAGFPTTQIAGENSEVYSPLNGMYVTPEVNQALQDAMGESGGTGPIHDFGKHIIHWNGRVKFGKTVLSPTTSARNWLSASLFAVANGHFDVRQIRKSIAGFREYMTQTGDAGKMKYLRRLKSLGVVYDTAYAGEMLELLKDANVEDSLFAKGWMKAPKKALDTVTRFYQYGDDFWKIMGFENEKNRLMKHNGNMYPTEELAEIEAAERIRNTYPTYSLVPRAIRGLRMFPLAGSFVSFPAEIVRTSKNQMHYLAEDMKTAPAIAAQRIAGLLVATGAAVALEQLTAALLGGMDEDDQAAQRKLLPEWQRNSNLFYLGRNKDGNVEFIDTSHLDPYALWKKPINAILRNEPWEDKFTEAAAEMLLPFFGEDMVAGTIREVVSNQKRSGAPIYNPEAETSTQTSAIAAHMAKGLAPGVLSNLERTTKAAMGVKKPGGQDYVLKDELVAWIGLRKTTTDPTTSLYYRTMDFNHALRNSNEILNSVARRLNNVSDSELLGAFEESTEARTHAFEEMIQIVQGIDSLGVDKRTAKRIMRQANMSAKDVGAVMRGTVPPYRPTDNSIRNAIKRAKLLHGEDRREEMKARRRLIRDAAKEAKREAANQN